MYKHGESLQRSDSLSSSISSDSSVASALAHHYNAQSDGSSFFKRLKERFTTAGMMERLLRKTVAKNTWLYTAVSKFLMRSIMGLIGVV